MPDPTRQECAESLLEQARSLYSRACADHRDALLACGRLLHDFVLAWVREGDGKSEYLRLKYRATRRGATEAAAESLVVENRKVNGLIATAMAADLLAGEGGVGGLRYDTLWNFARFVRRRVGSRDEEHKAGQTLPSDVEAWEVKPRFVKSAPALFARAAREGWGVTRARAEIAKLFRRASPSPRPFCATLDGEMTGSGPPPPELKKSAAVASPGDLVDMLVGLAEKAENPVAVAEQVLERLRQRRRERRPNLYERAGACG